MNGPAFPRPDLFGGHHPGLGIRDYFAAAAMTGLLADPEDIECQPGLNCPKSVAFYAYELADAMIERRETSLT